MAVKIQFRRDEASAWTLANPILDQGEVGFETDTQKFKLGDGSTVWASLPYAVNYDPPSGDDDQVVLGARMFA